jgi:TonB family protein
MYFDFEDYRPDVPSIGRVISVREGILLAFIAHLIGVILLLVFPRIFPEDLQAARARLLAAQAQRAEDPRFVFVQPRLERPAPKPPNRAEFSDLDRQAESPKRAPKPTNPLPYSRGNTPDRVEAMREEPNRGRGAQPQPEPPAGGGDAPKQQAESEIKAPQLNAPLQIPPSTPQQQAKNGTGRGLSSSSLSDAFRNLERYTQNESFENQGGGGGQFGPEIQFDTKGVEFGPWIRRFIAQVKRNWFVPYAAMSMKGHVVITFNVHKDGQITDLSVVGPSSIESFNSAAFGALSGSNPTQPLPPEYPTEKAFFTVTFFYNETPPR